jgi:UDP-N-acetylmuramoyl-tripeptide--D-alanyl-D-alanine ligase
MTHLAETFCMFDEIISKLQKGETSISIDSRTIQTGDIFFAIKGEQHDGHDFIAQALEKGASICVAQAGVPQTSIAETNAGQLSENILLVEDTIKSLQQLARGYRETLKIPVIGITGCNGKTTTKNFLASVVSQAYGADKVAYTKGNLNNYIGLPLTILSIKPTHEIAVIELGSNHPGEIAELCSIAKPTHGITTSIGAAHIEFFGTLEAIADEEGAIALTLPKTGLYAVPKNDQYAEYLLSKTSARKIAVDAEHIECLGVEFLNIESKLNEIGIRAPHIVSDALLVVAVADELGVSLDKILSGLSETKNDKGRFSISKIDIRRVVSGTGMGTNTDITADTATNNEGSQITVIDDTYNGNPDSVIAAIKAMNTLFPSERKIVALGCLKELGEYLHTGYERIVNTCNEYNVSESILINIEDTFSGSQEEGNTVGNTKLVYVKNNTECSEYIKKNATSGDVLLCKGSHGAKTWEVIEELKCGDTSTGVAA